MTSIVTLVIAYSFWNIESDGFKWKDCLVKGHCKDILLTMYISFSTTVSNWSIKFTLQTITPPTNAFTLYYENNSNILATMYFAIQIL